MKSYFYEDQCLEVKKKIVSQVQSHLRDFSYEVPGEIMLLRLTFRGWPEDLATEVIQREVKLYGMILV